MLVTKKLRTRRRRSVLATTGLVALLVAAFSLVLALPLLSAQEGPPDADDAFTVRLSGLPEFTSELSGTWDSLNAELEARLFTRTLTEVDPETLAERTVEEQTLVVTFLESSALRGLELRLVTKDDPIGPGYYDTRAGGDARIAVFGLQGGAARSCADGGGQIVIHEFDVSGTTVPDLALDFQHRCPSDAGEAMTLGSVRFGSARPVDTGRAIAGTVVHQGEPIPGVVVCLNAEGEAPGLFSADCVRADEQGQYRIEVPLRDNDGALNADGREILDRWYLTAFHQLEPIFRQGCVPAGYPCGSSVLDLSGPVRLSEGIVTELDYGCVQEPATLVVDTRETPGPIVGTELADVIVVVGGGDSQISSLGGDDSICPGNGNNTVFAGDGDDRVFGGTGIDVVRGQDGDDVIAGNSGADLLYGGDGDDDLFGQDGNDFLSGGRDNDEIVAGSGDDTARGGTGDDILEGLEGNDTLSGNGGRDLVDGGEGNDSITGGPKPDILLGGSGQDVLRGLGGGDQLFGQAGDDDLRGGQQTDVLVGGEGTDVCRGGTTVRVEIEPFEQDQDALCEEHIGVENVDVTPIPEPPTG